MVQHPVVRDVMTKDPVTIDPDAPLETAAAVMAERELRHLPVVEDAGRLIGMITDRDLRTALLAPAVAEYLPPEEQRRFRRLAQTVGNLRVRDVMTWDVATIVGEAPLAQAAALMYDRRLGCLPVIEQGRLVGIVTERDVLKALASALPDVRGLDSGLW
jgi:acetoin utilization protein AcuB